jgi:hypothetical protein
VKKKIFIAMLIATMSFSMVACGSTTKEDTKAKSSKVDETKKSKEKSTKPKTTENATENSEATNAPAFTYTDKSGSIYTTKSVNVRDLPDTSGNKLTTIKAGTELILLGQCNETGWYKVEYANDKVGYVSNAYASTDKPAVQNNANSGANNSGAGNGGSTSASAGNSGSPQTLSELLAYGAERGWYPMPYYEWSADGRPVIYYFAGKDGVMLGSGVITITYPDGSYKEIGPTLAGGTNEFVYGSSGSGPVIIRHTYEREVLDQPTF